ncbi:MAG TPA: hypothetical protein VHG30_02140 [Microvirga sp.]|nr:hypothetical protein [Microvirga sp.]
MARSTKSTSSKARGGRKAQERPAAKKAAAPQRRGGQARAGAKKTARRQTAQNESWANSVSSLLHTQAGREILADVLDAAAGVLRRNREIAQQVVASGGAALEAGTNAAQSAASSLADLAGETVRSILPGEAGRGRSGARGRSSRTGGKSSAGRK